MADHKKIFGSHGGPKRLPLLHRVLLPSIGVLVSLLSIVPWTSAYGEIDCKACHDYLIQKKVVHAAVAMGCDSCHSGIDKNSMPHKKNMKGVKGLPSEMPELCYGCHDKALFTKKTVHAAIPMGCTSCHNPHATDNAKLLLGEPPGLCYNCHDKKKFEGKVVHAALGMGCTSCHNPHSSDAQRLLSADQPDICYNCHDKKKFEGKVVHAALGMGCTSCHGPHSQEKARLLLADPPDLCFTCHDKAEFSKKNVHAPVAGGMCLSCHGPHAGAHKALLFEATNNVCVSCHTAEEIGNGIHVVRGFGGKGHPVSQAQFRKGKKKSESDFSCVSCHRPHSSDSIKLLGFPARTAFEVCQRCHEK